MKIKSNRIMMQDGEKAGVLTIEHGKITAFDENGTAPDAEDFGNQRIIPGIFDTHNHGTCGFGMGIRHGPAALVLQNGRPVLVYRAHNSQGAPQQGQKKGEFDLCGIITGL